MLGGEHDEAISIYVLAMLARRLLPRHRPPLLPLALTPRNDNSLLRQVLAGGGWCCGSVTCCKGEKFFPSPRGRGVRGEGAHAAKQTFEQMTNGVARRKTSRNGN
jgi:hypothetical protein